MEEESQRSRNKTVFKENENWKRDAKVTIIFTADCWHLHLLLYSRRFHPLWILHSHHVGFTKIDAELGKRAPSYQNTVTYFKLIRKQNLKQREGANNLYLKCTTSVKNKLNTSTTCKFSYPVVSKMQTDKPQLQYNILISLWNCHLLASLSHLKQKAVWSHLLALQLLKYTTMESLNFYKRLKSYFISIQLGK